jgi:hypothetical protein
LLKKVEGLPPVQFVLPIIHGLGLDISLPPGYKLPATLTKVVSSDAAVRTAGRLLNDWELTPAAVVTGTTLTVGPNLIQNLRTGAPPARIVGDLAIDFGGGLLTEALSIPISVAGTILVFGTEAFASGPVAIPAIPATYGGLRLASEAYLSLIWESAVQRYDMREGFENFLSMYSTRARIENFLSPFRADPISHPPAIVVPEASVNTPVPSNTPQPFTPIETAKPVNEPAQSSAVMATPEILPTQTPPPPGE